MLQHKFLALFVIGFLAVGAVSVNAETNLELQDVNVDIRNKIDIENFDLIIDAIIEYLKELFVEAIVNCLKEVAHRCKKIWYDPKELLKCAKEYFKEHKGECVIPNTLEYETMLMSIYNEDDIEDVDLDISKTDIKNYDDIINAIIDYLKDFFQQTTISCLKEVAKNCKKIWYNPKKLVKCAKDYREEHKGECAIPDSLAYETLLMTDNKSEPVESSDKLEETRNPLLQITITALQQAFKWTAKLCIKKAADHCKDHWNNTPALIDCGKKFFNANKGRCALG